MDDIVELLNKQKEQDAIKGIITLTSLVKCNKFDEIEDQAQQPRMIKSKNPKCKLYLQLKPNNLSENQYKNKLRYSKAKT